MERDFLGLNSKELPSVKEESKELSLDSASMKSSGMQWPFSNKVSALPQFMSFKAAQEERAKRMVFDRMTNSAFTISTVDTFDANHKPNASIVQNNFSFDRQVGTHNAMNTYAVQRVDVHRPHEVRGVSVSNQTLSISMGNPFFKTHGATTTSQNLVPATLKQQLVGGLPASGSIDPRNISKPTGPQLTVFYAGTVNVFEDVSPEKARAIMCLAGNVASMNINQRASEVSAPTSKPMLFDNVHGNQSTSTMPCSGLPSPISVTSYSGAQSGSGSSNNDEAMTTKSKETLITPSSSSQPEAPVVVAPVASPATTLMPAAVPQARKASLARFLEKRKERIMTVAPYSPRNKSTEGTTTSSFPDSKEQSWSLCPSKMETN